MQTLVAATKSKILDLAIRGKLVSQNPDEEPASVLLERIRAKKEELIKQGKIKRDKKESVIFKGEDNSYYQDLPRGWAECSILETAEVELGKALEKAKNTGTLYPYFRSVNIQWNGVDLSDLNTITIIHEVAFNVNKSLNNKFIYNFLTIYCCVIIVIMNNNSHAYSLSNSLALC